MVTIAIADDHPIVRRGMVEIVSQESDLKVIAEAGNVNEAMQILADHRVDILLLDLNMPGRHGLDAIKDILTRFHTVKILVMSAYPQEQFAKRVLRAGASGYLPKDSAADQLVAAIRKVARGGRYIDPKTADLLAAEIGTAMSDRPHDTLSDREMQVLLYLAMGRSIKEIAEHFSLSPKTVSTYRSRVLEKLDLKSNAEIARYAIEQRLIDSPAR